MWRILYSDGFQKMSYLRGVNLCILFQAPFQNEYSSGLASSSAGEVSNQAASVMNAFLLFSGLRLNLSTQYTSLKLPFYLCHASYLLKSVDTG